MDFHSVGDEFVLTLAKTPWDQGHKYFKTVVPDCFTSVQGYSIELFIEKRSS